jgi:DNA ligase (NAD+)
MDEETKIKNHMNTLIKKIKYHEHMFHVVGTKTIDDSIYDSWRKELEELENHFPQLVNLHSPSLYIGEAPNGEKVQREIPMLSLRHSYNKNEIERFCNDFKEETFIIEPKVDGVAVSVVYKGGKIESVSLRGNGYEGENISHLSNFIHDLPLYCNYDIEVRGEAYIPKHISYENKRNFTAGYLRKKKPEPDQVCFIAYKLIGSLCSQSDCLEYMNSLGFTVVPFEKANSKNVIQISEDFCKKDFLFETDGVVIKINNLELNLGRTIRYTRDAIAYKFSTHGEKTIIRDIKWGISRTGILVPTCVFDEIKINGCFITKCHGHNKKNLEIKKIGIGAVVSVVRIGNVIPYIEQVIQEGESVKLDFCPFCSSQIQETAINYVCPNKNCLGVLQAKFLYFFEKLEIKGLGEKLILRFFVKNSVLEDLILETIKKLKSGTWISDKNDQKAFENFQKKRYSLTIEDLIIASAVEGIANLSQLKKINSIQGKRSKNLKDFLDSQASHLDKILFELINP